MNETTIVQIGDPLPVIASVAPAGPTSVRVVWAAGDRAGREDIVDLAPLLYTRKLYRGLREDEALFRTVHIIAEGDAIAWGDDEAIDMAATAVERLAEEVMTPTDFKAFLERNGFTLDAAAAQLGISRRLVAYYASGKDVPRYIALACAYLDRQAA
jgi:hypothetical protein